jgi:hypothetical protein
MGFVARLQEKPDIEARGGAIASYDNDEQRR